MVAIAHGVKAFVSAYRNPRRHNSVMALGAAGGALLLGWAWFLAGGGDASAARAAANVVMQVASLIFVLYYIVGPLSRLVPIASMRALRRERVGITFAFAGMYGVFLVWIVAPYYFAHEHMPLPSLTFVLFSAAILAVFVTSARDIRFSRSASGRTVQSLSTGYFWVVFAINDLDHTIGPHRPDGGFHGFSLALLVLALLARFADTLIERRKAVISGRVV